MPFTTVNLCTNPRAYNCYYQKDHCLLSWKSISVAWWKSSQKQSFQLMASNFDKSVWFCFLYYVSLRRKRLPNWVACVFV